MFPQTMNINIQNTAISINRVPFVKARNSRNIKTNASLILQAMILISRLRRNLANYNDSRMYETSLLNEFGTVGLG